MNNYANETHEKNNINKVAFVDIDETICFYADTRIYKNAIPNIDNIKKINFLYESGWTIIYWTARGNSEIKNTSRLEYLRELTLTQLNQWGAKFHELQIGDKKPLYDLIIDDKAKRIEEL
jgi:hypothetical protein